jgi:hypothetical protein
MVLRHWIIPEPNPQLRLTIDQIDYSKLNYEDCRWIYSSSMKLYHKEFSQVEGFIEYSKRLFDLEELKQYQQKKRKKELELQKIIPLTPPPIFNTKYEPIKETIIPLTKNTSLPFKKIPFLRKHSKLSSHSENCNIH